MSQQQLCFAFGSSGFGWVCDNACLAFIACRGQDGGWEEDVSSGEVKGGCLVGVILEREWGVAVSVFGV